MVSYSKVNLNYKNNNTNTKAEIKNENLTIDNPPFLFYAMGPNGELPEEMKYASPPELHPSPSGNTILMVDNFDSYKTETEFNNSPWTFYEPSNTYCNLKEDNTLAVSGKRVIEFYDNNIASYTQMSRSFSAQNSYLYVKISLYAKQTNTGGLFVWLAGSGGYFFIKMGQNSNTWYYGSNGAVISAGSTYTANTWYNVELFANILKNTYDFYVDNDCKASNVSFYDTGVTNLNTINILTTTSETSSPLTYYIDSLEISIPPKIICLLVKFSDMANSNSVNTMYQKIFTNDGSLRNYYKENSYNKFTIAGTVTNWLMMPDTMVHYGQDRSYEFSVESLSTANPVVDFSIYDHVVIFHAGDDEAQSGDPNDIWSACYTPSSGYWEGPYDGKYINHICWVSELTGIGVAAHEFGHMLDLPDLYDVDLPGGTPDDYCGDYALMASGNWNGASSAASPAHMMAWCKIKMGWLSSEHIEIIETSDLTNGAYLDPLELSSSKKQVMKVEIDTNHYYLVESRLQLGFDTYLPQQGIIISYIDETKASGHGIVRIQNSHPGSTDLDVAPWDESDTWEWQVFRDISRKIYVTIGPKSGNTYLIYEDRYSSGNRTYETFNVPIGNYIYYDISMNAGEILVWDWIATNTMDFVIERVSDLARFEQILGVDHDGGIFRAPTSDTYELRVRNAYSSTRTLRIEVIHFTAPTLNIYEFISLNSPVYRSNQLTLRLQVRNTGGSLVEGVTATLNLPSGLSLDDTSERTVNIDDLGYYEYATLYWNVYAGSAGTKSVQVIMASTWGGSPTQNVTINILIDSTPPILSIISPSNYSLYNYNDLTVSWSASDSETGIKTISVFLNNTFIINTTGTSYNFVDLPDGLHYCKIRAFNMDNSRRDKLVIFRVDTKKPSKAMITSLIPNGWYKGLISLIANAYDNGSGVNKVEFYVGDPKLGGLKIGTDNSGIDGWSFNWQTSISDDGAKQLFIRVYDVAGNYNDSKGTTINIDNSPPTNLQCPSIQQGKTYSGNISIEITAIDSLSGIKQVEFWLDSIGGGGILLYNDTNSSDGWKYVWVTTEEDDGDNSVFIRVVDKVGNVQILELSIKVHNKPFPLFLIILIIIFGTVGVISTVFITKRVRLQRASKIHPVTKVPKGIVPVESPKEIPFFKPIAKPAVEMDSQLAPKPFQHMEIPSQSGIETKSPLPVPFQKAETRTEQDRREIKPPISSFPTSQVVEPKGEPLQVPIGSVMDYRCPKCNSPISAQKMESLQKGVSIYCSNCFEILTPKSISITAPMVRPVTEIVPPPSLPKPIQSIEPIVQPTTEAIPSQVESLRGVNCPDCNSPISVKNIEYLKQGLKVSCTNCSCAIQPELIGILSKPEPSPEPLKEKSIEQKPISGIQEDTIKSAQKSLDEQLKEILSTLEPSSPPKIEQTTEIKPLLEPNPVPAIMEYLCPHCNKPLPAQKVKNLQSGIRVLCPNCLKGLQPEDILKINKA